MVTGQVIMKQVVLFYDDGGRVITDLSGITSGANGIINVDFIHLWSCVVFRRV